MAKKSQSGEFVAGNSAHECVFGYLFNFGYSKREFEGPDGMGQQLIRKLSGYPSSSSPTAAAHILTHLALEICGWAVDPWEATPHKPYADKPLGQIGKEVGLLLAKSDATCLQLADLVDQIFEFPKESEQHVPFAAASAAIRKAIIKETDKASKAKSAKAKKRAKPKKATAKKTNAKKAKPKAGK